MDNGVTKKKSILGIVASVVVVILIQNFFFSQPTLDQALMNSASEINKNVPFMVDSETRLDNAGTKPGKILTYNYTLINTDKAQIDTAEAIKIMEPGFIKNMQNNPDMAELKKQKVTLEYNYKDKNGDFIFSISITPDKYGS